MGCQYKSRLSILRLNASYVVADLVATEYTHFNSLALTVCPSSNIVFLLLKSIQIDKFSFELSSKIIVGKRQRVSPFRSLKCS
jgi:hypothetical protein